MITSILEFSDTFDTLEPPGNVIDDVDVDKGTAAYQAYLKAQEWFKKHFRKNLIAYLRGPGHPPNWADSKTGQAVIVRGNELTRVTETIWDVEQHDPTLRALAFLKLLTGFTALPRGSDFKLHVSLLLYIYQVHITFLRLTLRQVHFDRFPSFQTYEAENASQENSELLGGISQVRRFRFNRE